MPVRTSGQPVWGQNSLIIPLFFALAFQIGILHCQCMI